MVSDFFLDVFDKIVARFSDMNQLVLKIIRMISNICCLNLECRQKVVSSELFKNIFLKATHLDKSIRSKELSQDSLVIAEYQICILFSNILRTMPPTGQPSSQCSKKLDKEAEASQKHNPSTKPYLALEISTHLLPLISSYLHRYKPSQTKGIKGSKVFAQNQTQNLSLKPSFPIFNCALLCVYHFIVPENNRSQRIDLILDSSNFWHENDENGGNQENQQISEGRPKKSKKSKCQSCEEIRSDLGESLDDFEESAKNLQNLQNKSTVVEILAEILNRSNNNEQIYFLLLSIYRVLSTGRADQIIRIFANPNGEFSPLKICEKISEDSGQAKLQSLAFRILINTVPEIIVSKTQNGDLSSFELEKEIIRKLRKIINVLQDNICEGMRSCEAFRENDVLLLALKYLQALLNILPMNIVANLLVSYPELASLPVAALKFSSAGVESYFSLELQSSETIGGAPIGIKSPPPIILMTLSILSVFFHASSQRLFQIIGDEFVCNDFFEPLESWFCEWKEGLDTNSQQDDSRCFTTWKQWILDLELVAEFVNSIKYIRVGL